MSTAALTSTSLVTRSARLLPTALRGAVVAAGLLAGALLAVLLADIALRSHPAGYIAFHQATTVLFTGTLPVLGVIMTSALVVSIVRHGPRQLLVPALGCGILGMLITVVVHFPLNATIMSWPVGVIPADFESVATRWLVAHLARTALTIASFIMALAALSKVQPPEVGRAS